MTPSNRLTVKPRELLAILKYSIQRVLNVLVVGGPGIGKSDIVRQAARACGADYLVSHPAVDDPTDPKGFPFVVNGEAIFLPFKILKAAMAATTLTVWVLEDLGQAPAAVQAAYMQLLLDRRVGEHVLPDCVVFVACTNRREDRAGVAGVLEPVKSRFATIVELEPDLADWVDWALDQGADVVPPTLIAYHRYSGADPNTQQFYRFQPTADLVNSPLPRTWVKGAAPFIMSDLPREIRYKAIAGAVGATAANDYLAFEDLFRALPDVEGIIDDPEHAPIPTNLAALYAVSTALAALASQSNFDRISVYVKRMIDAGHAEFATLLVRDAARRHPEVQETVGFIRLTIETELGAYFVGATPVGR